MKKNGNSKTPFEKKKVIFIDSSVNPFEDIDLSAFVAAVSAGVTFTQLPPQPTKKSSPIPEKKQTSSKNSKPTTTTQNANLCSSLPKTAPRITKEKEKEKGKGKEEETIELVEAAEKETALISRLEMLAETFETQVLTFLIERLSDYEKASKKLDHIEADHLFRLLLSLKKIGTKLRNASEKFKTLETETALQKFMHEEAIRINKNLDWMNAVLVNLTTTGNCHLYLTNKQGAKDGTGYLPTKSLNEVRSSRFSFKKTNTLMHLLSTSYQAIKDILKQLKDECKQLRIHLPKPALINQNHSEEAVRKALSSDTTNLYDRLGVNHSASLAEIKAAYRKRARIAHPDKKGNEEWMKRLCIAYETLSDPEKREIFDAKIKLFDDKKDDEITIKHFLGPNKTPISEEYKKIHAEFCAKYQTKPLRKKPGYTHIKPPETHKPLYQVEVPCTAQREVERVVQQPGEAAWLSGMKSRSSKWLTYYFLVLTCYAVGYWEFVKEKKQEFNVLGALSLYFIFLAAWVIRHPTLVDVTITETEDYETTETISTNNLYALLEKLEPYNTNEVEFSGKLTAKRAIQFLLRFLRGEFYGRALENLQQHFTQELEQRYTNQPASLEITLFEGILGVISRKTLHQKDSNDSHLIEALEKITHYAKQTSDALDPILFTLFKNTYFRNLFSQALHAFWDTGENLYQLPLEEDLDARHEAKQQLEELRKSNNIDDLFMKKVRQARFKKRFETLLFTPLSSNQSDNLREKAFLCLDWIAFFRELGDPAITINLIFRAGLYFQAAGDAQANDTSSSSENKRMADQKLALTMYRISFDFANQTSPEMTLYTGLQLLRYLSKFTYDDPELRSIIPAYQHRLLWLTNLFPFYSSARSNFDLVKENPHSRQLMQRHLVHLVDNLTTTSHNKVHIIYQAYEACLNRWYAYGYSENQQAQFRAQLMALLLEEKGWHHEQVQQNINHPSVMIDRNQEGWLVPSDTLSLPEHPQVLLFTSIEGVEINDKTGEISFLTKPWMPQDAPHRRRFSSLDLLEILEKKLTRTMFSLDSPDPDLRYHPFNNMRIIPSRLYGTEFLNTMFLCDYLLKFFTVGSQPNANPPYLNHSIESLIQPLPAHLKQIITAFNEAPNTSGESSLHRFWIEAEEIQVALPNRKQTPNGQPIRILLNNPKMLVKKHKMLLDEEGNMVDDPREEEEGWPIYSIDKKALEQWQTTQAPQLERALLFVRIKKNVHVFFIEKDKSSKPIILSYKQSDIQQLHHQPKAEDGKVLRTNHNAYFLFQLTKQLAEKTDKPHHFTSEYIFALTFTEHYDEFTEYFPEFGRLRELCKVATLVLYLESIQEKNTANLKQIKAPLNNYRHEAWAEVRRNTLFSALKALSENWASEQIKKLTKARVKYRLDLDLNSKEVKAACQPFYEKEKAEFIKANGFMSRFRKDCPTFKKVFEEKGLEALQIAITNSREVAKKHLANSFTKLLIKLNINSEIQERLLNGVLDDNVVPLAFALYLSSLPEYPPRLNFRRKSNTPPPPSRAGIFAGLTHFLEIPVTQNEIFNALLNDKETLKSLELRINKKTTPTNEESITIRAHWAQQIEHEKKFLRKLVANAERLEKSIKTVGFGKHAKDPDLTHTCTWVPAAMQHGLFGKANRRVYGGVSLTPNIHESRGNNPTTAHMLRNTYQNPRVTRVTSTNLATQKTHVQQSIPQTPNTPKTTPNLAKNYRFFQAEEAKRASANNNTNPSRGKGKGVRSSGGAAAAAGGSGGDGGDGDWPNSTEAKNHVNALRLKEYLSLREWAATFNPKGELTPEAIKSSTRLPLRIKNSKLHKILAARLGNLEDWGKYETQPLHTRNGLARVHFYYNPITKEVYYGKDFKIVFDHQGTWNIDPPYNFSANPNFSKE